MFDVSFGEMLLIAIVALVVIGPEKLPKVARTLGVLAGRMQRYASGIKTDIARELQLQELQKMQQEVRSGIAAVESGIAREVHQVEAPLVEAAEEVEKAARPDAPPKAP
ncbi:Sec-independent protein translocase protein TatB [mine drainage metagenome]|uniref:Sec-independent protein translocase protein TatB n=1 Tax=mine drainage metagenome TaxID=410659 RepID=A0A1J5RAB6_9ZZZZ